MKAPHVTMHKRKNCMADRSFGRFQSTQAPIAKRLPFRTNQRIEGNNASKDTLSTRVQADASDSPLSAGVLFLYWTQTQCSPPTSMFKTTLRSFSSTTSDQESNRCLGSSLIDANRLWILPQC